MAFRGTLTAASPVGTGIAWFLLGEQEQSYSWPVLFLFGQIGASVQAVPYCIGEFLLFNTSSALGPTDFNSFGAVTQVGTSFGAGGIIIFANFYSVKHSPNPIPVGGIDIGLSAGVGWCPGRFKVLDSVMVSNTGSGKYVPFSALDDDSDLSDAVADATDDYLQNNTDPTWATA
jgi:hypothetical protein